MLKKENRLQKDKDFSKVFKGSRPIYAENLVLRFAIRKTPTKLRIERNYEITNKSNRISQQSSKQAMKQSSNETMISSRFGFVISNKISKLATRRNALKRQLRMIVEKSLPNIKPGYDVVMIVKRDFSYPYKQKVIEAQVINGLGKAGILKISN